jgi:hypothetical protein
MADLCKQKTEPSKPMGGGGEFRDQLSDYMILCKGSIRWSYYIKFTEETSKETNRFIICVQQKATLTHFRIMLLVLEFHHQLKFHCIIFHCELGKKKWDAPTGLSLRLR